MRKQGQWMLNREGDLIMSNKKLLKSNNDVYIFVFYTECTFGELYHLKYEHIYEYFVFSRNFHKIIKK